MASLFTSQLPANGDAWETSGVMIGTLLTFAISGQVTGCRWRYPAVLPASPVVAKLYQYGSESSGTELASATFSSPTAGAWNTVNFGSPVTVVTGTKYLTAVWSNRDYVRTDSFFSSALTNGYITAPADSAGGRNGKFEFTNTPKYPGFDQSGACYFVDVLFTPSGTDAPPEDVTPVIPTTPDFLDADMLINSMTIPLNVTSAATLTCLRRLPVST